MEEPELRKETRFLDCNLTADEFVSRASDLAEYTKRVQTVEEKKKAVVKEYAEHIGGLKSKVRKISNVVAERKEKRSVDCTWHPDWVARSMILRRDDTQEPIQVRTMTPEEIQMGFGFEGKRTPKGKRLPPERDESDEDDAPTQDA